MNGYLANQTCPCPRCRARGLMGAAALITLGVLFLLSEFTSIHFHESFPVLLIVLGLVMWLGRTASIEGHVQPPLPAGFVPPPPPPTPGDSQGPEVTS